MAARTQGVKRKPSAAGATASKPMSVEIGSTGLRQYGGFVHEEFIAALAGLRGRRVYREMADNEPTCAAILFAMTMMLRQVEWSVQEADESEAALEAREFVEGALFEDMSGSWPDVINEICTMFESGFAVLEIVWKKRMGPGSNSATRSKFTDGLYAPRKLALRGAETIQQWAMSDDGGIDGLHQQPYAGAAVDIPIERVLLFRTTVVKNNPEGRSILRSAYRPWYFKKRIEEIEGIGIERDLAGYPIMRVPSRLMSPDASAGDKAALATYKTLVSQIRRDKSEGALLPSDRDDSGNLQYDLTLLTSGGTRQIDTVKVKEGYAREIAMSVLADFIFLGQKAVGSFALSSDKTEMFATAMGGFLTSIASVFNRHLLQRMWAVNGLDPDLMPTLVPGDVEHPDIEKLIGFITGMVGAGATMFPDVDLENALRKMAGLPLKPVDVDDDEGAEAMPGQRPAKPKPKAPPEDDAEAQDNLEGDE
jgi:hypothetical protein